MSGKATLYFVVTKVNAPKGSTFNLVLSVGDSKITLGSSSKSRGNSFSVPYKISKEVTNSPEGSSNYRSCVVQINFLEGETVTATGSTRINPGDFLNVNNIDTKDYPINVPNMEAISAVVGLSVIPEGGSAPGNYAEFGETAKVISTEARQDSDSSSHHSHHRSSQPEQPAAPEGQMDGAEEIIESESGRKHRRKRGTKDTPDGTFISDGGHSHKRRHRSHTSQPAAPPAETPPPAPEPTPDNQMEGAEEIVESESGRKHRRKRGTKDTSDGTFISDGGHSHKRKHRSHKPAETPAETPTETKTEEPKPAETKTEEPKPAETKTEEPKPVETKQEAPKPAEPKQEEPKPVETKQEEPKPAEQEQKPAEKSAELQITETQDAAPTEEHQQLVKKVSDLKDVVEKQTNWIRSLYSKLNEHGISQSLRPDGFPNFPTDISDFSRTLKPRSLKIGEEEPIGDNQKACQTGEFNSNLNRYRAGNGVQNIEEERYEDPNFNYDDGPLRHFHFARNEIKEPEEPIFSTSDGLTLSYSIRNDCFFRPHYNFEMLDISGRFSFEVFQSPFEIEEESLSIDCKYNPTIEFNSGDGGYQDIPAFSPTRSRFQTEIKGRAYFDNENQNDNNNGFNNNQQYTYRSVNRQPRSLQMHADVFSPTGGSNTKLSISGSNSNDAQRNNENNQFVYSNYRSNQPGYRVNDEFNSAFYNSTERAPKYGAPTYGAPKKPDEPNNYQSEMQHNPMPVIQERNIELNQFSNSSNSFPNQNNSNQDISIDPNFSPSSSQSLNSQPLLIEQQNLLKQKIQEQMQKQQKQIQKQMDELHQMRKELTEQTQQMQEQMALQMQEQMALQQQNIQSMQLDMEKKKQMMQLELEKERKQMDNSKQLLELQMEKEKDTMEKERAQMEKERQALKQQRLLQEEELLQLKNQRELQKKEMLQLQRLQELHKQQQEELQEQQEQHIQQRKELQQQQQSLSPSLNQQTDFQQPNFLSNPINQQTDSQQQPFSPSSFNQDPQAQPFQQQDRQAQPFQQQDPQSQPFQQQDPQAQSFLQPPANFNLGGNRNQPPPFPQQNSSSPLNNKSRQFDCKIFTDETIYVPPKKKQDQQNQPFSQNNFNDHESAFNADDIITQEEEEEVDNNPITGTQDSGFNQSSNGDATTPVQKINFNQEASLNQNSNNGIVSEALDNSNSNYPQTKLVSFDDDDANLVLHRSNTDVSNKNINKILTFDKSTAPPLLNQAQEASPILKQQGRTVKSTSNFDPRNLSNPDGESNYNGNNEAYDESLLRNLEDQTDNNDNQFYPRPANLKIPKDIVA